MSLPQKERIGLSGELDNASLETRLYPENFIFRPPGDGSGTAADGTLRMKFGWNRKRPGQLSIVGRRLDAPSKPLRAFVPQMDDDIGFQPSTLFFPEPGCWEVTGKLGEDKLTFVVLVMKIGRITQPASSPAEQTPDR